MAVFEKDFMKCVPILFTEDPQNPDFLPSVLLFAPRNRLRLPWDNSLRNKPQFHCPYAGLHSCSKRISASPRWVRKESIGPFCIEKLGPEITLSIDKGDKTAKRFIIQEKIII